jgi:hypothetical protein
MQVGASPALKVATVYEVANGEVGVVAAGGVPSVSCTAGACSLTWTLQPLSASTIVLR